MRYFQETHKPPGLHGMPGGLCYLGSGTEFRSGVCGSQPSLDWQLLAATAGGGNHAAAVVAAAVTVAAGLTAAAFLVATFLAAPGLTAALRGAAGGGCIAATRAAAAEQASSIDGGGDTQQSGSQGRHDNAIHCKTPKNGTHGDGNGNNLSPEPPAPRCSRRCGRPRR